MLGGAYLGPISTTRDMEIALRYSIEPGQKHALLLKIQPTSETMGANVSYVSCFPEEQEYLYPPCTYLKPPQSMTKYPEQVEYEGVTYTVVELEPSFPS